MLNKVQLNKFDVSKMNDASVTQIIGKRGTGKSLLLKDIIYHKKNIEIGAVISPTEDYKQFFETFIQKKLIHHEYDNSILLNLKEKQAEDYINRFLIMDDCDVDIPKNNPYFNMAFHQFKLFKINILLTTQVLYHLPPSLRNNVDYVFIFRDNTKSNRRKIYENYGGMFETFEQFSAIMDKCTENYECLVIDNTSLSNKIEDQIFWYKADEHEDFYVEQTEEDESMFNYIYNMIGSIPFCI